MAAHSCVLHGHALLVLGRRAGTDQAADDPLSPGRIA
jgi:hypothetical protein